MNCTTQTTVLFVFNRGRDHKQAQPHPQECASGFFAPPGHPCGNQILALRALFSGVSGYLILWLLVLVKVR